MNRKFNPKIIWEGFHWSFFVNTQGLIISLLRFEKFIAIENIELAKVELRTATELMLAAASSMELAGNFSKQDYEDFIRPTMMPPVVNSDDFSGLMFWDHASLMATWKKIKPRFKNMPVELKTEHDEFISAYMTLSQSHKKVCSKFGGDETGSLRTRNVTAIQSLNNFEQHRKKLISS